MKVLVTTDELEIDDSPNDAWINFNVHGGCLEVITASWTEDGVRARFNAEETPEALLTIQNWIASL